MPRGALTFRVDLHEQLWLSLLAVHDVLEQ
jgi:hypothetical protein